ncbi:hypothetical protein ACQP2X_17190 [Actinoplanes sp. CA-131856]
MSIYGGQPSQGSPPSDGGKSRSERRENRIKLMTAAIGLLAAIAGALGAFWGATAKRANSAEAQVDSSNQTIADLQQQINGLREQLAQAQAAASATPTPAPPATSEAEPPTSAPDAGPEPDFVKNLKVPLTNYTSIQVSQAKVEQSVGVADLYYEPRSDKRSLRGGFAKLSTDVEARSKEGCSDAVETRPTVKPVTRFTKGMAICTTRSGWVALLVVTSVPDSEGTVGLQVTFWG